MFVRLTGCPLRCAYCDTEYAFHNGDWFDLDSIVETVRGHGAKHVCVTGGEPLAQPNCLKLLERLCDAGFLVSLETSGALDIAAVDPRVSRVVDVKTPGSREESRNRIENFHLLTLQDQLKFVICSREDYDWSKAFLREHGLPDRARILFSPSHGEVSPTALAEWILADRLPVRFQLQLHRFVGRCARQVTLSVSPGSPSAAASASNSAATLQPASVSRAIVLLSGGLDSTTVLAIARSRGFACYALSVHYGQRHSAELDAARSIARALGTEDHRIMGVDLAGIGGSALTDPGIAVPESPTTGIPITYVPARNTLLLSLALGWAEVVGATDIFVGVNAVDYSGYPDCRPEFIEAFEKLANVATKAGVEGARFKIQAPLIRMSKVDIIRTGAELGVDYGMTVSCYQADGQGRACGKCDSCRLRAAGFAAAGMADPTRYQ